jgi:hypothetical protein
VAHKAPTNSQLTTMLDRHVEYVDARALEGITV